MSRFEKELLALRPLMAKAAQKVYDEWEQDEEGQDEKLGSGGICDQVSEAIGNVLSEHLSDVEFFDGGQDGDDHAWVIVQRGDEAYGVDIPPRVYESGGGYKWEKIEDVTFKPEYVVVFPVDPQSGYEDA